MRELKFRVWDKKFYYRGIKLCIENGVVVDECGVISEAVIQQYTGLKDKNGKEIFEGDIIETVNFIGIVEFANGSFYIKEVKAKIPMISKDLDTFTNRVIGALYWDTVIGNIFENKELLK